MNPKSYPCLKVLAEKKDEEMVMATLEDLGATAVEIRDGDTMEKSCGGRVLFLAGFPDEEVRTLALCEASRALPAAELEALDVTDDGWSRGWRDFFEPVILETIRVITPWMEAPEDERGNIVIDPGMAFGTGGHATTKLVLRMIEERAMGGGLPDEVFDVGIGSGVLSIAAVIMGAGRAEGVDVEPESVEAVKLNAAANGVSDRVHAFLGGPGDAEGRWPMVLANIELRVFKEHAGEIAALVGEGGEAILSGLLEDQVDDCLALWPGFVCEQRLFEDGWAALALRREK